jgi:hypothetical protein
MEGTLNKLALFTALLCAVSLAATPADAKKRTAKKPAAGVTVVSNAHQPGTGPARTGGMCWSGSDTRGFGFWTACKK